ncbi:bifunctional adenosylcobinamide kinase/adenosylcobinamide-phosphate guanylyltransferase [Chloroflexota bacterium]
MADRKIRSTLIIGGARSGKSNYAQELALKMPQPVLFVATAEAGDEEMRQRIEIHKRGRPDTWRTLEATNLVGDRIQQEIGAIPTVIVDCITLLVNNVFNKFLNSGGEIDEPSLVEKDVMVEISSLVDCINQAEAEFIVVTNEVGQGLVPASNMSRLYRDLLGKANRILAQNIDDVYLMIAGLPVKIK